MAFYTISRPKDDPGPLNLDLHLSGGKRLTRGGSIDVELDPERDARTLLDLKRRFTVTQNVAPPVITPQDPGLAAFLSPPKVKAPAGEEVTNG